MLVLKKKEIVACALVVLIGVAGYLNWSYQDTVRVTDGDEYIETGKKLGEAQYVNSETSNVEYEAETTSAETDDSVETSASADYFAQAKIEKENSRSKALEILKQTAENESFDEETRKNAQQKILDMASNTEKESIIENIAKAKGYNDISVYIDGEETDIIVKKEGFSDKDVTILKELVALLHLKHLLLCLYFLIFLIFYQFHRYI